MYRQNERAKPSIHANDGHVVFANLLGQLHNVGHDVNLQYPRMNFWYQVFLSNDPISHPRFSVGTIAFRWMFTSYLRAPYGHRR
jgi:hypothetical protein